MKEPEIYDFAEQLTEPDLTPEMHASSDASNDYFNILQDLQKSLADSAVETVSENETEAAKPVQFADGDPSLDFAFAEDATATSADAFQFNPAQFEGSPDPNLQFSLDDDFEMDFESLVELPPAAVATEKTDSANDSESPFAESDNAAFSEQFQEFLEELENGSETNEPENSIAESNDSNELSLPDELPSFLTQPENYWSDSAITAELPAPETFGFDEPEENAVEFTSFAPFAADAPEEFEAVETNDSPMTETVESVNFAADVSPFAEKFTAETVADESSVAEIPPSVAVEDELPEVPAFFDFSAPLAAVAEPEAEEFADDETAAIAEDLMSLEAATQESVAGAVAAIESAPEILSAEETAVEVEESREPEMLESATFEPENEVSAEFSRDENVASVEDDVETDELPEPPAFLSAAEEKSIEDSVDETVYETAFAAPQPETHREESAQIRNQYIVFSLADNLFAFPASCIDEIGHPLPVTNLPFVPEWFSGVASLRGDIIAVLDLRRLWQKPAAPPETRTKMLVVRSERENLRVGLMVDGVSEMLPLGEEEIAPSADFSETPFSAYLTGVSTSNGQPLLMLNPEQFLTAPEIRQI